jgi:2TM domain
MRKKQSRTEAQIEDSIRTRAEKKVRSKTGLLWLLYNLGSYVLVNAALITIWILSDSDYPWFLWVMVVWAGGLAFHFAGYIVGFRYGASRESMIEEQMALLRKKKGIAPVTGSEPAATPSQPTAGPEATRGE